jgi:hypothetical protein
VVKPESDMMKAVERAIQLKALGETKRQSQIFAINLNSKKDFNRGKGPSHLSSSSSDSESSRSDNTARRDDTEVEKLVD